MKLRKIRSSLRGPVTLFVISLVLVVLLLILWNVVLAVDYQYIKELASRAEEEGAGFHWAFLALGSVLFVATIALVSVLGAQLFGEIRFNQRLGRFIATFTHELNSPLASIKLFAQTLRRTDLPAEERERFLDLILTDVERLHGQISNVLRTAQVDAPHGIEITPEVTDLREYLAGLTASRQAAVERLEGKDITIVLSESGPANPTVSIDRMVFRQALDNLIDNSLKYALPGAVRVELTLCGAEGGNVALEVRDNGCGIPKAELKKIFDPFHRVEPKKATARRQGTGLGLWIVLAIVEAHDGDIMARSEGVGEGTTIRIELPLVAPAASPAPVEAEATA